MSYALQLSVVDRGGARFNGFDLMRGLEADGRPCRMAVFQKLSNDPRVEAIGRPRTRFLYERYLAPIEARLARPGQLGPAAWELYGSRLFREASLLHAHILPHGWFNLAALPHLARRKPLVWTLHDPWALTGHCIYPMACQRWLEGCGSCPDLAIDLPLARDRTAALLQRKRRIYARTRMHLVVVSRWMERMVRRSPLLRHHALSLIPLGLDTVVFKPIAKSDARRALALDPDRAVLSFRATRPTNRFKGTQHAVEALLRSDLPVGTQVVAFDQRGTCEPLRSRFDLHEPGWVDDEARAALIYAASDLFLMPSLAEAFGMMALEAMACGTPALVYRGTALQDVIEDTGGGEAVPSSDVDALAAAIGRLMADPDRRARLAAAGGDVVRREYTFERYVRRHAALYDELLGDEARCAS